MAMGHRALVMTLRWDITHADHMPGAQLPTLEQLAAYYEVSRSTASRAIHVLADEGLVDIVRGRGIFFVGNTVAPEIGSASERVRHHLNTYLDNAITGDMIPSVTALANAYHTTIETAHAVRSEFIKAGKIRPTGFGGFIKA